MSEWRKSAFSSKFNLESMQYTCTNIFLLSWSDKFDKQVQHSHTQDPHTQKPATTTTHERVDIVKIGSSLLFSFYSKPILPISPIVYIPSRPVFRLMDWFPIVCSRTPKTVYINWKLSLLHWLQPCQKTPWISLQQIETPTQNTERGKRQLRWCGTQSWQRKKKNTHTNKTFSAI